LAHKKSDDPARWARCALEPPGEQSLAAADEPIGPESPQGQDQRTNSRAHPAGQLRRDRGHRRHHFEGETEGHEHAPQQIKKISRAPRRRILSHSSMSRPLSQSLVLRILTHQPHRPADRRLARQDSQQAGSRHLQTRWPRTRRRRNHGNRRGTRFAAHRTDQSSDVFTVSHESLPHSENCLRQFRCLPSIRIRLCAALA